MDINLKQLHAINRIGASFSELIRLINDSMEKILRRTLATAEDLENYIKHDVHFTQDNVIIKNIGDSDNNESVEQNSPKIESQIIDSKSDSIKNEIQSDIKSPSKKRISNSCEASYCLKVWHRSFR